MRVAKAVAACGAIAASTALGMPPVSLGFSGTAAISLYHRESSHPILVVATTSKQKVRSCNKGDNRRHHGNAFVNAWAVACEFPPRSEPNLGGIQGATAAIAASQG